MPTMALKAYTRTVWMFEIKTKQAIKIIYKNLDYQEALTIAGLPTVKQRRLDMCKKLFIQMQN